jgi:hypothetical protein
VTSTIQLKQTEEQRLPKKLEKLVEMPPSNASMYFGLFAHDTNETDA